MLTNVQYYMFFLSLNFAFLCTESKNNMSLNPKIKILTFEGIM